MLIDDGSSVASSVCPVDSVVRVFSGVWDTLTSTNQRGLIVNTAPACKVGTNLFSTLIVVGSAGVPPVNAVNTAVERALKNLA